MFRSKFAQQMREEISIWNGEGLLPDGLADTLAARYPDPISGVNATVIATIFGAILLGAGVLLFIAGNWEAMGPWLKVFLIAVSILLSNYFGWRCRFEPGNQPKFGTALLLIGQFFYGGGIWLIGQIFNLTTDLSAGLFIWALGCLGLALATRLPSLSIMASIVGGAWLLASGGNVLHMIAFTVVSLGFSIYVRSRWSLICSLVAAAIFVLGNNFFMAPVGLVWYGIALFALHLRLKEQAPITAGPLKFVGAISAMLGFLILTFYTSSVSQDQNIMALGACALGCIVVTWTNASDAVKQTLIGTMLALLLSVCVFLIPSGAGQKIVTYSVDAIITAGLLFAGVRLRDQSFVNIGIVFLGLFITARYFDTFFMALNRSAFFIVGGAVLLAVGLVIERGRRKLINGWQ